jgi:hypothetical protein
MKRMKQSKVGEENEVTLPDEIREKVRRGNPATFEDIHRMLFKGKPPKPITVEEMDEAIADDVTDKYLHGRR